MPLQLEGRNPDNKDRAQLRFDEPSVSYKFKQISVLRGKIMKLNHELTSLKIKALQRGLIENHPLTVQYHKEYSIEIDNEKRDYLTNLDSRILELKNIIKALEIQINKFQILIEQADKINKATYKLKELRLANVSASLAGQFNGQEKNQVPSEIFDYYNHSHVFQIELKQILDEIIGEYVNQIKSGVRLPIKPNIANIIMKYFEKQCQKPLSKWTRPRVLAQITSNPFKPPMSKSKRNYTKISEEAVEYFATFRHIVYNDIE
jgi:hypothetical protein